MDPPIPHLIRFEAVWIGEGLARAWRGTFDLSRAALNLSSNIRDVRAFYRRWRADSLGRHKKTTRSLISLIEPLELRRDAGTLGLEGITELRVLRSTLADEHHREEVYWRQRSRVRWLEEGDRNTAFFHRVADGNITLSTV